MMPVNILDKVQTLDSVMNDSVWFSFSPLVLEMSFCFLLKEKLSLEPSGLRLETSRFAFGQGCRFVVAFCWEGAPGRLQTKAAAAFPCLAVGGERSLLSLIVF